MPLVGFPGDHGSRRHDGGVRDTVPWEDATKCRLTESENRRGEVYRRGSCVGADQSTPGLARHTDATADGSGERDALVELSTDARSEPRAAR